MSKIKVVENLKNRNKNNLKVTASEYFGNKFTYQDTFKMFTDYKNAFINLDGLNDKPITISAPTTVASVNCFYGAMDANKIVNLTGPGFLTAFTKKYTTDLGSETVVVFDSFLNNNLINNLEKAGVKNVIVTSITDYMNPIVKKIASIKGAINSKDFLDSYIQNGNVLPKNIDFIRLNEFAKTGSNIKEDYNLPYIDNKIGAYFLTGATTSRLPKTVKLYADGLNKMADMYDNLWFDFQPGDRQTIFIPLFYATGAIHGMHAGLFSGMTLCYKPKYDRFAFAHDLIETKAKICLVAPSHVATLEDAGLKDNALNHLKYIFIGGEAIMPAQMKKFRKTASRLGINYILNGYGMTETGSMSAISRKHATSDSDVSVEPAPGVKYRIVDPDTREELSDNQRGILEKFSPCQTAGYIEKEKNNELFTEDNWINTSDVAIRFSDGSYRIYGRGTDFFEINSKKYYMFDMEEKILEHSGVLEAEVIKFNVEDGERPAIVIVLKKEWHNRIAEVIKDLSNINIDGIEYLIGIKPINKFGTNPITSKRDYLILPEDTENYYYYKNNTFISSNIINNKIVSSEISPDIISIKHN